MDPISIFVGFVFFVLVIIFMFNVDANVRKIKTYTKMNVLLKRKELEQKGISLDIDKIYQEAKKN